jgi:hypothetical protein
VAVDRHDDFARFGRQEFVYRLLIHEAGLTVERDDHRFETPWFDFGLIVLHDVLHDTAQPGWAI